MKQSRKFMALGAVAGMALLGACSDDAETPEEAPTSEGSESADPTQEADESEEGPSSGECADPATIDSINSIDLQECIIPAFDAAAGFVQESQVNGEFANLMRVNYGDETSLHIEAAGGLQVIVIGDDAWLSTDAGSTWVAEADASTDEAAIFTEIAGLFEQVNTPEASLAITPDGELAAAGTEQIDGQEVFLFSGTATQEGLEIEVTIGVTAEYAPLLTEFDVPSQNSSIVRTNSEWNQPQEIAAPAS